MTLRRAPPGWLGGLRAYLALILPLMLLWEVAQLPLYTIWQTGSAPAIALAVLHCTAGDGAIALGALGLGLILAGDPDWPHAGFVRVLAVTIVTGLAATIYLEWLNVEVRRSWAYAAVMPRLPVLGTGLAPVLQWLVLPVAALLITRRRAGRPGAA